MGCRGFEQQLDALVAAHSGGQPNAAAMAHMRTCVACRQLFEVAAGQRDTLDVAHARQLTAAIVGQTTGSACGQASELLAELVMGTLPAGDAQLARLHAEQCQDCARLQSTLVWVAATLPQLMEVQPDSSFVSDVLAATALASTATDEARASVTTALATRVRAGLPMVVHRVGRFQAWWGRMMQRPRFALELAYSFAILLALLCGTPISPLREAPGRLLGSLAVHPNALVRGTAGTLQDAGARIHAGGAQVWDATGGRLVGATGGLRADVRTRGERVGAGWDALTGHVRETVTGLFSGDFSRAALALRATGGDCRAIWNGFFNVGREGRPQAPAHDNPPGGEGSKS